MQNVPDHMSSIATTKEETCEFALPHLDTPVASVLISVDVAMLPMADSADSREAVADPLPFCGLDGEPQHTVYVAEPCYGKQSFLGPMEREMAYARRQSSDVLSLGNADGARSKSTLLERDKQRQLIDCFDTRDTICKVAEARDPHRCNGPLRGDCRHSHCTRSSTTPKRSTRIFPERSITIYASIDPYWRCRGRRLKVAFLPLETPTS